MTDVNPYNSLQPEPLLVVISGPSGVGKDAVVLKLKELKQQFYFVVTATTRLPRPNEVDGVDYFFLSQAEFNRMIEKDEFLEYAHVYNDCKGIPKAQVRKALASGKDVIMRLDVQGAATIRKKNPEAILIFLTAPDEDELVNRLKARQTESTEDISARLAMARQELERIKEFDYVLINHRNKLDETLDVILSIIKAEHHRVQQRKVIL